MSRDRRRIRLGVADRASCHLFGTRRLGISSSGNVAKVLASASALTAENSSQHPMRETVLRLSRASFVANLFLDGIGLCFNPVQHVTRLELP